jgi:D-3-phosphoglycerate dehydrogenase
MTYHVLVPDNVHQAALDVLEAAQGISYTAPGKMPREDTLKAIPEADGLIIRSSTKANAELLAAAPRLKVIARAGVGVDNVDLAQATRQGIVVMNTPDGNTIATAEHTMALMLALARHIPQAHQSLLEGRWDRKLFMGTELRNKTLGVVGAGRIGKAVARRAQAFEMRVIVAEPCKEIVPPDLPCVEFDELLAEADYISLHPTLTDETRGMINAEAIAKMKPGVRIINAARGAIIDDLALAEAVKNGQVAGAALDVYAQEPPSDDHPLIGLLGVIHTPHLAASTVEAQIAVAVDAAKQVVDVLLNATYKNVVNPEVLEAQNT